MRLAMICFSLTGLETGEKLAEGFRRMGHQVFLAKKSRYLPDSIKESAAVWAGKQFSDADGIIFIGACGIAVRSVAPYVENKKKDPAVLVADECGRFVISLLSGHLGGANELTKSAAKILKAVPVITTATDLHGRFAVDVFAKKNQCGIYDLKAAKEVSAAILSGEPVGFYSEFPWEGELPEGLLLCGGPGADEAVGAEPVGLGADEAVGAEPIGSGAAGVIGAEPVGLDADEAVVAEPIGSGAAGGIVAEPVGLGAAGASALPRCGVAVTIHRDCRPFSSTVQIIPRAVALGVGCRKGKEGAAILKAASECLEQAGIFKEALFCMASIDLKKEEPGLLELSKKWELPFAVYGTDELLAVPGEFTPSAFVKKITGVENVCERSAVLAADPGKILKKKNGAEGVTTALALKNWRIRFE